MVIHSVCTSALQFHRGISTLVLLISNSVSTGTTLVSGVLAATTAAIVTMKKRYYTHPQSTSGRDRGMQDGKSGTHELMQYW